MHCLSQKLITETRMQVSSLAMHLAKWVTLSHLLLIHINPSHCTKKPSDPSFQWEAHQWWGSLGITPLSRSAPIFPGCSCTWLWWEQLMDEDSGFRSLWFGCCLNSCTDCSQFRGEEAANSRNRNNFIKIVRCKAVRCSTATFRSEVMVTTCVWLCMYTWRDLCSCLCMAYRLMCQCIDDGVTW